MSKLVHSQFCDPQALDKAVEQPTRDIPRALGYLRTQPPHCPYLPVPLRIYTVVGTLLPYGGY